MAKKESEVLSQNEIDQLLGVMAESEEKKWEKVGDGNGGTRKVKRIENAAEGFFSERQKKQVKSLFGQGFGGFVGADWDSPDLLCTFQAALDSDEMQLWELGFDAGAQVAIFPHRRFPHFFERDSDCFTVIATPANIQHKDWQGAEGTNRGIAAILTPSEDEFRRFVAEFAVECAAARKNHEEDTQ